MADVVKKNEAMIAEDTLADRVIYTAGDDAREWSLNGEKVFLSVKKV